MKMFSRYFLILAFTISITSLYGQDIFYTVSGEIDAQKVGLDSIVIVNTQNGTKLLFDNLTDQPDYVINLSTKSLWGSTGISDQHFENGFNMIKNSSGELIVSVNYTPADPISISIYNIQGQEVFTTSPKKLVSGNSINVKLAGEGIYFVKIQSSEGAKTFKTLGSNTCNSFSVSLNYQKYLKNTNLKRSLNTSDSDFSFQIGDDLRVSVYKSDYWAASKTHAITASISLVYTFETSTHTGTFNDSRNEQTYKTVLIGNQTWFAENLNFETYDSWWYDNSISNGDIYGRLYTWDAAITACPSGWHLPSENEWKQLEMYLGMSQSVADEVGYRGTDEGKKMKSTSGWFSNGVGTDAVGFSALPGGNRKYGGGFYRLDGYSYWWSATKSSSTRVWYRSLIYNYDMVNNDSTYTEEGFSVRCLMDSEIVNTAPLASFTVTPGSGTTNTTFAFDASGSTDLEDTTSDLMVRWDFNGDDSWDTDWVFEKNQTHQYTSAATFSAKLEVKDTKGLTHQTSIDIIVSAATGEVGTFTDPRDNQTYNTIEIGNQTWFAENLNFSITPSWSSGDIYGRLYKWTEAINACPSGWHLPSDDEWKQLEIHLGMSQSEADGVDYRGTDEGSKLKSTSGWDANGNGTNSSGFSALPGGYYYNGVFYGAGTLGYWWTSSVGTTSEAWARTLFNTNSDVFRYDTPWTFAFSVRCIKD